MGSVAEEGAMKTKHYLYIGGGVAALFLAAYGVKKARAGFGIAGYSSIRTATAAAAQVAKAAAGSRLTDYRSAQDRTIFDVIPTSNGEAHYHAAYWLAVASRLTGSWTLAGYAAKNIAQGNALTGIPGSSWFNGDVQEILKDAANHVSAAGPENRQLAAVAKLLSPSAGAIAVSQKAAEERSSSGVVRGTVHASVADTLTLRDNAASAAGAALNPVRAILGLRDPNTGQPPSTAWKWGLRLGVVGLGLLGLRFVFSPQYKAAKAAVTGGIRRAKAVHAAATS
jgi:hypothetical protein